MLEPYYRDERVTLYRGDSLAVLPSFAPASFDSLVSDAPAAIGFMNAGWDKDKGGREQWIAWLASIMREALRAMKPGAHGLVWALPRTAHWTGMALEDAGFEVRDKITHIFAQGFPKSKNVGGGLGTALKPASEDWILVRKPLSESGVAANVERQGTGALRIDACRINPGEVIPGGGNGRASIPNGFGSGITKAVGSRPRVEPHNLGRWPTNLILDEFAAELLDEQSGERPGGYRANASTPNVQDAATFKLGATRGERGYSDQGGASRFFFVAKASKAEREAGLEDRAPRNVNDGRETSIDNPYQRGDSPRKNTHPTVKPVSLMRHLVRLVTPPGGSVLDPFAGSGTTGVACVLEGLKFVGVELSEEYCDIAARRIAYHSRQRLLLTA